MSTLATFISTLGFKMDGSFDQAMLTINKRLNGLGNSLGGAGGQLSKSLDAASKRVQAAQMNLEAQKLKSEAARMAASDKQYAAELKRINSISNAEEKLAATKTLNAERFRAKEQSHILDMEKISTKGVLEREKLALRVRQQDFKEEQAHLKRTGAASGRGGSGVGLGGIGGIPVRGHTTLGMMAGGFGISELVRQSYQVANYQASRKPTFEFITKDAGEAAQNIQYLDSEVKRLSLNLITANKDYITLFASGYQALGSKGTQELFTGFQEIATMMNLGEDAQHRGLLALGQMMSKGKVQAEELRGQLAEALPNAVQIFADAITNGKVDVLLDKMQKGQVTSKELLKVAAQMRSLVDPKKLAEMMNTPAKQLERLKNSWASLIMAMNQSGLWGVIADGINEVTKAITELTPYVPRIAEGIKGLIGALNTLKYILPFVWAAFKINTMFTAAAGAMTLTKATNLLAASLLRVVIIPAAIVAGLALIADAVESIKYGREGVLTEWSREGGALGYFADILLTVTKIAQILGIIDKSAKQKKEEMIGQQAEAEGGLTKTLMNIQSNPKITGGAEALNQSLMGMVGHSSEMTPEMKHRMVERVKRIATPEMLQYRAIPSLLKQLDAGYQNNLYNQASSDTFRAAGGLNAPQTINITVQNTEPNVTKDWLSSVLPDLLGGALQKHVQKEAAFTPNMLLRGS